MKRVVLDTNVTISAFFWKGHPRTVYDLVREGKVTLLSSLKIEAELIRALSYSRFGLISVEILPIVNDMRKYASFIEVKSKVDVIKEDITDNIFLECALDGKADYIISGDHHLLDAVSFEGIQIVKARDFLVKEGFI
ncbi:MAG: putative toxin-antitoxin system toxin component, PIN family [Candidatus Brocadiaceae bacterium]|nr:putative toxin-antitoxin system toxin component, PIN family [Candidatus Brocadiaceae bacterium]